MKPIIEELQSTVISTIASETLSFVTQAGAADAGEAAGQVVYAQLANNKVLNLLGNQMGSKAGTGIASSIVFTTGVMDSTLEVQWDNSGNGINAQIAAMVAALSAVGVTDGSWTCHYPSGLVIVRKKTAGTTQAITSYKVRVPAVTVQTGDIEIGAVEIKNASTDDRMEVDTAGRAHVYEESNVTPPVNGEIEVTASATSLSAANAARKGVLIRNGSAAITLGPSTVTAAANTETLAPGDTLILDNYGGELYGITGAGSSYVQVFTW